MAENRPIIVIRKKAGHGGHHGGAWKVAYADFVTAMMALFIVLWLLNSSKKVQEAVGGYFKDPTGKSKKVGNGQTGSGQNFELSKDNMDKLKEELEKAIHKMTNIEQLKNNIEMTVTSEGLRIELLESDVGTFFNSGSGTPSQDGKEVLIKLAAELGKLPNKILIEGHTDSKPFAREGGYSNWELSADRANGVRRLMQDSGLGKDQVTQVRGYADQLLRKADSPMDASNRRISLIVRHLDVEEKDEPEEAKGEGHGEAKSEHAEAKPEHAEAKPEHAEAKPEHAEAKQSKSEHGEAKAKPKPVAKAGQAEAKKKPASH